MSTPTPRGRDEVLADAIRVLTEAARLTRLSSTDADGREHRRPADWAEFVAQALAGAAANIGSIGQVLAGRPGSWEAAAVRNLLESTVGADGDYLLEHRTEPVTVTLYVDLILSDAGTWKAYDDAQTELQRRYGSSLPPRAIGGVGMLTADQERQLDELAELEMQLDEQRIRDWTAYGRALTAHIETAAAALGLRVPVAVTVELDKWPGDWPGEDAARCDVRDRLRAAAIEATPLPPPDPLQRVRAAGSTA